MFLQNRIISLVYKIILITLCAIGIIFISGWTTGIFSTATLNYYTTLSNILVFIFFTLLSIKTACDVKKRGIRGTTVFLPRFKGAVTLTITVTFLVYHFVLAASGFTMSSATAVFRAGNQLVHYIIPIMVIVDWILFDKKAAFRIRDPFLWLFIPLLYFVFILIRARFFGNISGTDSAYPYFFIDISKYGFAVIINVLFLALGFLVLGFIICGIDRLLAGKK